MAAVEQDIIKGIPLVGRGSLKAALVGKVNNPPMGEVGADLMGGENAP
jgi:hypothetical protein